MSRRPLTSVIFETRGVYSKSQDEHFLVVDEEVWSSVCKAVIHYCRVPSTQWPSQDSCMPSHQSSIEVISAILVNNWLANLPFSISDTMLSTMSWCVMRWVWPTQYCREVCLICTHKTEEYWTTPRKKQINFLVETRFSLRHLLVLCILHKIFKFFYFYHSIWIVSVWLFLPHYDKVHYVTV